MPIVVAILIVIGAFFAGNSIVNHQVKPIITEETKAATPSPTSTSSPTPYQTPEPPSETYKQQLMFSLMLKITARYADKKNSAVQAKGWDKQFLQCINNAEQNCLKYSQPIENPFDMSVPGLPDVSPGPIYYSPQQQRQLCDGAKLACSPYLNSYKIQTDSFASADNDIKEWKNQLVEIVKDCSVCISDYQAGMKKFDEFDADIIQSIK